MNQISSELESNQDKKDRITILVADDHPLMRKALKNLLEKQPDLEIVAEAGDGEEAVRLATQLVPDVVIMDIRMPKLSGLEAIRQIKAKCPGIAILVLTVHDDSEYILGTLEAGAAGYLIKSVDEEEVLHAIRGVVSGEMVLSAPISPQLLKQALQRTNRKVLPDIGERLTSRELEVLKLAARGMSNKDISQHLNLSLPTVKGYLADIFNKFNVGSRTEAVIIGLRAGFLTLDDLE